ncbi:Cro/CI family transcriptional regulator [Acidiferrobacter thiooxydans]|jgi:DNA-binding transcriptional regulator YdaS (Cro superfamily)|uniref:Cro/Cl family transcriptional regulator n=1 Tax=Acidiferrobacter thiooxydans TaxID=163359 RepID=A0A368HBF9_9GAMM|nr:Cro/Cl family transcriptional regulator [Acidiferrobacter thiooxydans]UEO01304.1 Cro/Cl family transcriptional regulator [Acidiferrobacter thiooxydans]
MRTKDAIKQFRTAVALARALGCTPQAIYQWGERVPKLRAYQIELLTKGQLKVDNTQERSERHD